MGDLTLRISMLVQQGYICQTCGDEIDNEITGSPRYCDKCIPLHEALQQSQPDSKPLASKSLHSDSQRQVAGKSL